jgi:hypothetical protein
MGYWTPGLVQSGTTRGLRRFHMTISEYLIKAAEALRSGAAEDIVKLAMRSDGHPPARIETMIRWCRLHNERTAQ